jgi:polyphosphate kinase
VTSADWMPRNFFKRIEVAFPILDGRIRDRILQEILLGSLQDVAKVRQLQPDGTYRRSPQVQTPGARRSQSHFMELARKDGPAPGVGPVAKASVRIRPGKRPE